MKKTARLLAILLAVLLGVSALAAFPVSADNTGLPPDTGTLTIHKYIMPDLDYAALPNDGNAAGVGSNPAVPDSAEPIAGIVFDMFLLTDIIYLDGGIEKTLPIRDNQNGLDNNTGNVITTPLGNESMYAILDDFDKFTFTVESYEAPTKITLKTGYEVVDDNYPAPREIIGFKLGPAITLPATDDAGVAASNPVPKGFYLVVEQLNDKVASIVFPFVTAVPMTNATGNGWIEHVHVYPKNGDISINKYIDRNAVHLGEKVMFDVVVSVPADIRTYSQFDMSDVLDSALTYAPGSLKVYGYAGTDTDPDPVTLADGAWTLFDASTVGGAVTIVNQYFTVTEPASGNGNTLTVAAKKQTQDSNVIDRGTGAKRNTTEFWKLREYNFVRFEFEAIVNENILSDRTNHTAYTFENNAKISFKNKFDTQANKPARERTSNKVRAHAAAIILDKLDANTNAVLEGAKFKIATSEANARAGSFLKHLTLDPVTQRYSATGVKTLIDKDHIDYANPAAVEYELEAKKPIAADEPKYDAVLWSYIWNSGSPKAVLRFDGLKEFGNAHTGTGGRKSASGSIAKDLEDQAKNSRLPKNYAAGDLPDSTSNAYLTYWIVETFTPAGYNLLLEPIRVDFGTQAGAATGGAEKNQTNYKNWYTMGSGEALAIRVRNSNKFTLPKTGGIGTILFTAGGAVLIAAAVALFFLNMRKKKQQAL